ncbi:MAG: hypothetical protein AAFQ13_07810 [Pseudomonadota bacterium]
MRRMKWTAVLALAAQLFVWPVAAIAQDASAYRTVSTTSWVEEWDPATQSWVRVSEGAFSEQARAATTPIQTETITRNASGAVVTTRTYETVRFAAPSHPAAMAHTVAQYGPFLVTGPTRAVMVGSTGSATPAQFDAMLRDFPELVTLEMVEAPGTTNDIANLEVGRRIRAAGLTTYVPNGGSVRSGAVELFLAGQTRRIDPGAQFAVHSWLDNHGREPEDFGAEDPANRLYINYYTEMGMSEARAKAFYAMTNSVPHASALWLRGDEMRRWIEPVRVADPVIVPRAVTAKPAALPVAPLDISVLARPARISYEGVGSMLFARVPARASHAFLDS